MYVHPIVIKKQSLSPSDMFPQVWAKPARELGCQGLRPVVREDAVNKETILKNTTKNHLSE